MSLRYNIYIYIYIYILGATALLLVAALIGSALDFDAGLRASPPLGLDRCYLWGLCVRHRVAVIFYVCCACVYVLLCGVVCLYVLLCVVVTVCAE